MSLLPVEQRQPEQTLKEVDEKEFRDMLERACAVGVKEAADGTGDLINGACFSDLRSHGKYYLIDAQGVGLRKRVRSG